MKLWNSKQINKYAMKRYRNGYQAIHFSPMEANQDTEDNRKDTRYWKLLAQQTDVDMKHPQHINNELQQQLTQAGSYKLNGGVSPKDADTLDYLRNQSRDITNNLRHKNQKRVQKHLLLLNQKLATSTLDSVAPIHRNPLHKTVNRLNHAYVNSASLRSFKAPTNIVEEGYLKNLTSELYAGNYSPAYINDTLAKNSKNISNMQKVQEKYINKSLKSYLQGNPAKAFTNKKIANHVNKHYPNGANASRLGTLNNAFFVRTKQIPTKDPKHVLEKNYVVADKLNFKDAIKQSPKDIQDMAKNYKKVRQHKQQQVNRSKGQKQVDWLKKAFKGINEKRHSNTHNLKKNNTLHAHKQNKQNIGVASKKQVREAKRNQGREI